MTRGAGALRAAERLLDETCAWPECTGYRRSFVEALLARRMLALHMTEYAGYGALLQTSAGERARLRAMLPAVYTQCFRDEAFWDRLGREILPALLDRTPAGSMIRVWNPGCATGQELHTLAMLFAERLGRDGLRRVSLLGTDVSEKALSTARAGCYAAHELESVPRRLRDEYFAPKGSVFAVDPAIANATRFVTHDLLRSAPHLRQDLIVCRNTLIYFEREQQARLLAAFHYGLVEGGYLVLGACERTHGLAELAFATDADRSINRKLPHDEGQLAPWLRYGCTVLSSVVHPRPLGEIVAA